MVEAENQAKRALVDSIWKPSDTKAEAAHSELLSDLDTAIARTEIVLFDYPQMPQSVRQLVNRAHDTLVEAETAVRGKPHPRVFTDPLLEEER